jgi:sugar lactone lactonase YvrE
MSSFTSTVPSNGVTATALADNLPSIQSGLAIDGAGNIYVGGNGAPTVKQIGGAQVSMYSNFIDGTTGTAVDSLGNVYLTGTTGTGVPELVALNLSGGKVGPKPVNVNMVSGTLALNFDVAAGTTIGSIAVLTNGVAGKDFADAGGSTCKALTYATETACVVNVHVTPHSVGLRLGAVVISDTGGNVLAIGRLYATGSAPQMIFRGGTPVTVATGLSSPLGLKVDGAGNVLIADSFNARVLKVTPAGVQSTVGSGFTEPSGIAVDGAGNVFVADLGTNAVYKVTPGGVQTTYLSGLSSPYGLSMDATGSLYVSEPLSNTVLKVTQIGVQTTIGSGYNLPYESAVDIAGNLYVGDFGTGNVFKVTPAGVQTTFASGIAEPTGVAVDAAGDVYVAAFGGSEINQITPSGVSTAVVSSLSGLYGVALDPGGNLYYTDYGANLAGKITQGLSPTISFATTAGGSTSSDSPKIVALQNVGNATLHFTKVSYAKDFPKDASGNATACIATTALTATGACTLTLDFKPVSLSGTSTSLALSQQEQVTTDTLNAAGTISHVTATGTEIKLVPTLTLTAAIASGSSLLLTVHAAGSGATPTGTVSFYAGGVLVGTSSSPLSANGNVSFTTPRPTQRHTYQAVNTGDAVYASAKSNGVLINPTTAMPAVTLTVTPNPATVGQSVTFKAAVSTAISGVPPTGSVKFSVSNVVVGTAVISGGVATFSTSTMTAGTHTIVATYLADANYLTATSNSVKETITP